MCYVRLNPLTMLLIIGQRRPRLRFCEVAKAAKDVRQIATVQVVGGHDAQTGAMHRAIADDDRVIVSGYGLVHNWDVADA